MECFDEFSKEYDLMINWPERISREKSFYRTIFKRLNVSRVLDAGCGTGKHAIEFSKWGLEVVGCDISPKMIERAKLNAQAESAIIQFETAAFQELTKRLNGTFDAIICVGNNLAQVTGEADLRLALQEMHKILSLKGVCIIQLLNYEKILKNQKHFMPLKASTQKGKEFLFFRFLDLHEKLITLYVVTFIRNKGEWTYSVRSTKLQPWRKNQLLTFLFEAGFTKIELYGTYTFEEYEPNRSTDLIIIAYKDL
ncbi:MAG: class I SAM-dependent methyltransferase [Candidatus Heimdallarchaeota archaeon]